MGRPATGCCNWSSAAEPTLREFLDTIETAAGDSRVKGLVARLGDDEFGLGETQQLRDAIAAFRAKGKFAMAFADSFGEFGPGTRPYYLATAFDRIWLQPMGDVGLTGLYSDVTFLKGTFDLLGVVPQFDHREQYKTAMNSLTETSMTLPQRDEVSSLLASMGGQIVGGIASGRKLSPEAVRQAIDHGPLLANEARQSGLVDRLGYLDEALAAARTRAGSGAQVVRLKTYRASSRGADRDGGAIALIYGNGLIVRGNGSVNPLAAPDVMGADEISRAFRAAVRDPKVRAILFRIDSPGGSVVASETIWREVVLARRRGKPVVVSMGDVAGSGGYYIAAAADRIVAEPATLTGSIGVLAGKLAVGKLLAKLGISTDSAQLGANAGMFSPTTEFSVGAHARTRSLSRRGLSGIQAARRRRPPPEPRGGRGGRQGPGVDRRTGQGQGPRRRARRLRGGDRPRQGNGQDPGRYSGRTDRVSAPGRADRAALQPLDRPAARRGRRCRADRAGDRDGGPADTAACRTGRRARRADHAVDQPAALRPRSLARSLQPGPHERADLSYRPARLGQHRPKQVPDMRHPRPDFECYFAAGSTQAIGHARRVVAQDLVAADLNQCRRQAPEIAVDRRCPGVTRIGAGKIAGGDRRQFGGIEHRVGLGVELQRRAGQRQIGPRRQRNDCRRQRPAFVAQFQRQRKRQPAAGGIADHRYPARLDAVGHEPAIRRRGIVERRRERKFGRQPVVDGQHLRARRQSDPPCQVAVKLGRAGDEAAAVQIKHVAIVPGGIWDDALGRDPAGSTSNVQAAAGVGGISRPAAAKRRRLRAMPKSRAVPGSDRPRAFNSERMPTRTISARRLMPPRVLRFRGRLERRSHLPLSGLRVVDLTRVLAGPFCSMMLADMGAEVIKIELPGDGDPVRRQGVVRDGLSWYFAAFNRNKRSLSLNLRRQEGRDVLAELIRRGDVLVENFRPGVLAGIGFDQARLDALNPNLIYCNISGFGNSGPYRDRPSFDFVAQAMSGFMSVTGEPDGAPMRAGPPIADLVAGLYAALGICAALVRRGRTGRGDQVGASLNNAMIGMLGYLAANHLATGAPPPRTGNDHPIVSPYGMFRTSDGEIAIAPSQEQSYQRLIDALGLPELRGHPDFLNNELRVGNRRAINAAIEARLADETSGYWIDKLNAAGVPCDRVKNLPEVFADPQTIAQQMVVSAEHPGHGEVSMLGFPIKFAEAPCRLRRPAPDLGADTDAVLTEIGYTPADLARLRAAGAV